MPLYLTILSLLIPVIVPHAVTPALILPAHVQHTIPALTHPVAVLPALIFLGTRTHALVGLAFALLDHLALVAT